MTVHQWAGVLNGIAVALLGTWLLLIAAVATPTRKGLRLEAAYRRFSASGALPSRDERLRLQLLVVAVLIILSLVTVGILLVRAESTSTRGATPRGLTVQTLCAGDQGMTTTAGLLTQIRAQRKIR